MYRLTQSGRQLGLFTYVLLVYIPTDSYTKFKGYELTQYNDVGVILDRSTKMFNLRRFFV